MAELDFVWRQGDTAAPIVRNLTDAAGENVALNAAEDKVFFRMAPLDGGDPKVFAEADITNAVAGEVTYEPESDDTDTPGLFLAEFVVHYGGDPSNPQTFPNEGYLLIQISPRAGVITELGVPLAGDLCTLSDVARYVPAFTPNDHQTLATLRALIAAESDLFAQDCGCEIVQREQERTFVVSEQQAASGRLWIGDLAVLDEEPNNCVPLYGGKRFARFDWQPITQLEFPDGLTVGDQVVVAGTWGFPAIPPFVREAVAKRVILRYLNDVANAGNDFSEAIENINLGALFASSQDAIERLNRKSSPFVS